MASQRVTEEAIHEFCEATRKEAARVLVGYDTIVNDVLTAVLAGGHVLVIGLPGLGKTLLVKTLAAIWGLKFSRIQFTPDLLPSDITGTEILQEKVSRSGKTERVLEFQPGPVFANLLLADEINRTPPKTQSALLQAMEEREVTIGRDTYELPTPFTVMATQNPIELEGTFPLPEAQLDRFLLSIELGYPGRSDELKIAEIAAGSAKVSALKTIPQAVKIPEWQKLVDRVAIPESLLARMVDTVRNTRPQNGHKMSRYLEYGAGPRATQFLVKAARARALVQGERIVTEKIVKAVLPSALRHRLKPGYLALSEKITLDEIIEGISAF